MPEASKLKIAVIGAGNVASHLAPALAKVASVMQICATTLAHAEDIANKIPGCQAIDSLARLNPNLDLYLIAAADRAVASIAEAMPRVSGIVAHTSGSVPLQALSPASPNIGVFYPLQTFSKTAKVDVAEVPFFTEASNPATLATLDSLVSLLGPEPRHADSRQRGVLHVAAVFACNFANHLWAISHSILEKEGYPLSVFEPLLRVTLDKAMSMPPAQAQTGPASRGDQATIAKHTAMLSGIDKDIYTLLTKAIINSK